MVFLYAFDFSLLFRFLFLGASVVSEPGPETLFE